MMANPMAVACSAALTLVVAAGCGGANSSTPTSPPSENVCAFANVGPLLKIRSDQNAPPPIVGGAVVDGVYDLVDAVSYRRSQEAMPPTFRWSMRLTSTGSSSNHIEGRSDVLFESAPRANCASGQYAATEKVFRILDPSSNKIQDLEYSATPNGLSLFMRSGDNAIDEDLHQPYYVVWTFKRR